MKHPKFDECYLVQALEGQQQYECAYFVPIDLYREVNNKMEYKDYRVIYIFVMHKLHITVFEKEELIISKNCLPKSYK